MIKGAGLISRALGACVGTVVTWPKTTIAIALVLVASSGYYAAGNLGVNTDTANMISADLKWRKDFIAFRESFPSRDRNIVVVVDGPTPEVATQFSSALADALRSEPENFESVFLAGHGEFFEREGLYYLPLDELESLSDRLIAAQPLLGQVSRSFNGASVIELATEAVERSADGEIPGGSGGDPELGVLLAEIAATLDASRSSVRRPLDWAALLDVPTDSSKRQLLLVRPTFDFTRMQPARPAIERLRKIADSLRAGLGEDIRVRLTGTAAMEHEELLSVTRSASTAGIAALVLVTIVLFWALRSPVLLLISLVTLLSGLACTAAFAALAVGHLNLLSVAFAVLYVGLGVDFILHLTLRLKELIARGQELGPALVETARSVGTSLVICAVTTAAGFYAFIPTEFDGVSELGIISGTGMIISLIVSVTLLPALIVQFWRKGASRVVPGSERSGLPTLAFLTPRQVLAGAAVLCAACLLVLPGVRFDGNPIRLRDPDSESIRALEELAADSEAPLYNLVALADDRSTAERWSSELERLPVVDRVLTVDSLVPEAQEEKAFVLRDLDFVLGPDFGHLEEAPFEAVKLRSALEDLRTALGALPLPGDAERALLAAVTGWLGASADHTSAASLDRMRALDEDLRSDLAAELETLGRAVQAEPFARDALPPELSDRWVNASGQQLIEIVPAEDVSEDAAARRFVSAVRSVVPAATGLPVVYQEASKTVVSAFGLALIYALLLVTAFLVVFLDKTRDTLLVLVPILSAGIITAGMTVWLGIPFNFANIIALPLLIGVGVDSGIHMVHRMRTEPPENTQLLNTSTSRAVLASGLTTIASFGNLAFSMHVGMASMGQLLTLGMAVTLASTLILLPAIIKTWGLR